MNSKFLDQSSKSSNHQLRPTRKIPASTLKAMQADNNSSSLTATTRRKKSGEVKTSVVVRSIIDKDKTLYQIYINDSPDALSESSFVSQVSDKTPKFTLVKRYSELLEFYQLLKKRYKTILVPHFPGKHRGRNSLNLVEYRRKKIQRFFYNLFNLKLSNFSKKKILDIIGTIGALSFQKSLKGNLKGIGSFFDKQMKNYIYDQIDKKELVRVYADLERLSKHEQILSSLCVFVENEAKLFLKLDEKYFRFLTILNHYFSNKSIQEKNNLLESLNTFKEVEYLRKRQESEQKIEQLDKSVYQTKSNEIGPLRSSMEDINRPEGAPHSFSREEPFEEVQFEVSAPVPDSFSKISKKMPQFSEFYKSKNVKTLDKRKERELFILENGQSEDLNVFKQTMSKINDFFEIVFEVKCELDDIGRVRDVIFNFFRHAVEGAELQAMVRLAQKNGLDLKQVFSKK